jgi:hypothetical protein
MLDYEMYPDLARYHLNSKLFSYLHKERNMKLSQKMMATTAALVLSLPVLADEGHGHEAESTANTTQAATPMVPGAIVGQSQQMSGNQGMPMMNPQMMRQMGGNQGMPMMNRQMMPNMMGGQNGQMMPNMMGGQNGQMMPNMMRGQNGQMMSNMMGRQNGQAMNPQMMHQMMSTKQAHMARMEGLLTSIDASLKELTASQRK